MEEPLIILVIDDSADDRALYRRVLKNAFDGLLKLAEEASGEGGFEAIEKLAPVCVLLDYSLPGRNGIEVLKRIRSKHAHLPVIMLTGQGNEAIAVQSMKEGAQDYISKSAVTADSLGRVIRMAIENRALQRRIDEQHASLELFAHALAHDLKEPVRTVRSFSSLIANGEINEAERAQYLRHIRSAGDRMALLIDSVLAYTQLDGQPSERENFRLGDAVTAAKANLAAQMTERNTVMSVDPLPTITGNRIQIIQLLQHLISNAICHSPAPVQIRICAERDDEAIRVSVHDNGPGIAAEHHPHIFKPFRRLNRDDAHGGFGLAISQKIVEMHGWKIGFTSAIGTGSIFTFTLPDAAASGSVAPVTEAETQTSDHIESTAIANVLLVDDRDEDVMLARALLTGRRGMQCNFLVANDGRHGLEVIRAQDAKNDPVDLILLDINMPIMNGFEMLEEMSADITLSTIPVVMSSGSTRAKDEERSRALGAVGYLAKPANFLELQSVIAKLPGIRLTQDANGNATLMRVG